MSSAQIEPAGVAIGLVAIGGEIDYVFINAAGFSNASFGKPVLFRAVSTTVGSGGGGGSGLGDVFCVPPDPPTWSVPPDPPNWDVQGPRTC